MWLRQEWYLATTSFCLVIFLKDYKKILCKRGLLFNTVLLLQDIDEIIAWLKSQIKLSKNKEAFFLKYKIILQKMSKFEEYEKEHMYN